MNWNAAWIWHPPLSKMDNLYVHFRREINLGQQPEQALVYVTACSLYKLYINGIYIGRGPNPSDPSLYYYDTYDITEHLCQGPNVVAALCYNYGAEPNGILRQNWGRGGFLLEMRDKTGQVLLATDQNWLVHKADAWDQDVPVNCTLLGDFKEIYDMRRTVDGWTASGFDASEWSAPEVLGRPPVEPWTNLIEREIPHLGGECVSPVNVYWESASVTYSWRDDWEVYREQKLAPTSPHQPRDEEFCKVCKTHDDFSPSLILDFGRDVTGYPEIHVTNCNGGKIDILYGEDLNLVRVDQYTLRSGSQILQPFNRRTFRYMKLEFVETPAPIEISRVFIEMNTYPVDNVGFFSCSDDRLNRIWETGAYTMRMCMLDHYVDCPWRERTLYGGDLYIENMIGFYAFGDLAMTRKCLRQMFNIQYDDGALPPWGPYAGAPLFYPAWSAYVGLTLIDYYWLSGDNELIDDLWPGFSRLLAWTLARLEQDPHGLIAVPEKRCSYDEWLASERTAYLPWQNFCFYMLLKRGANLAKRTKRDEEAVKLRQAAQKMAAALREHLVDKDYGMVIERGSVSYKCTSMSGQYDNALFLWSHIPDYSWGRDIARRMFMPETSRIQAPFHGWFVTNGLLGYGEDRYAVDFIRCYWGAMLDRGAGTFWDLFSLDWPPLTQPSRQTSLCHGWAATPTYVLPAFILGVRPLEPGFKKILIEPRPADLSWADGFVPTPQGPVLTNWQRDPSRFRIQIHVPEGSTAQVSLPSLTIVNPRVRLNGQQVPIERKEGRFLVDVSAGRHVIILE